MRNRTRIQCSKRTRTRQWPDALKSKCYSLVEGNRSIAPVLLIALLQSHLILSLRFICTQPRHSVCLDVTHVEKLSYLIIIIRCCQLTAGYKDSFTNGGGTQHYATMHADISNQFRTHFSISLPECQWLIDLIRIYNDNFYGDSRFKHRQDLGFNVCVGRGEGVRRVATTKAFQFLAHFSISLSKCQAVTDDPFHQ